MNGIERMRWAGAGRLGAGKTGSGGHVPLERLLLAIAAAASLVGAFTHPLVCAALAIALATALTLRRMRDEIRELHAWDERDA